MRSPSAKETSTHTERCDQCGLWFAFLHAGPRGTFLCRVCLELEGGNRERRGLRHGPGWTPGSYRGSDTSGPSPLGDPMSEIDPRRRG
jgi:hypothetical protein